MTALNSARRRRFSRAASGRLLALVILVLVPIAGAHGQSRSRVDLHGQVRDAVSGEPIALVQLLLEPTHRTAVADAEGRFRIARVPAGAYAINLFRLGYESALVTIDVGMADSQYVALEITQRAVRLDGVVVQGDRSAAGGARLSVDGGRLREQLATTVAETLRDEPGVAMRSMGPAPARPVVRGMGGERLLVLEDGGRTGDLSATSSDHAVAIDPLTAGHLEIIRGPATLQFGSAAIGGVVNVSRGLVPRETVARPTGGLSLQGSSQNSGIALGGNLSMPAGPLSVRIDGSYRTAGDVQTPIGKLRNTGIETYSPSVGLAYTAGQGSIGAGFSYYHTDYGVPGGFLGAHPNGARVVLERKHYEIAVTLRPDGGLFHTIEASGTYSRYVHDEFEASGVVGVRFGVLTYHGRLHARTRRLGPFKRGSVGLWTEYRDYASSGLVFTPRTIEQTGAAYAIQEADIGAFLLRFGLRMDLRRIAPDEEEDAAIGFIRTRRFAGGSGSVELERDVGRAWRVRLTVMRSVRLPSLEELFSEGPHLAAYSFEVGDPELGPEKGWGVDLNLTRATDRSHLSISAYSNWFQDYIFHRNTGRLNVRLLLPMFQTTGATATIYGGEASGRIRLSGPFWGYASASLVRGTLSDTSEPLPWMPPFTARGGLRLERQRITADLSVAGAGAQRRLGPSEEPTEGYALLGLSASYNLERQGAIHTVTLTADNLTDVEYRDHLSRVKSIMPEPGRTVRLLYRVYF